MQWFRLMALRAVQLIVAVLTWCLATPLLLADTGPPEPPAAKSYVLPYMLVVLCCALGLTIVGRSAHRRTELKYSEDDD